MFIRNNADVNVEEYLSANLNRRGFYMGMASTAERKASAIVIIKLLVAFILSRPLNFILFFTTALKINKNGKVQIWHSDELGNPVSVEVDPDVYKRLQVYNFLAKHFDKFS